MTTLEDVARWHDSEATVLEALAAQSGFGKDCAYAWAAIKHRASAAACRELIKYRLVDDESQPHPCPDHALRASYRDAARKLRKKTDAALAEIE